MSIQQEVTNLLAVVDAERLKLRAELVALGVSSPTDEVNTIPQMRALDRGVVLAGLDNDLRHFLEGYAP